MRTRTFGIAIAAVSVGFLVLTTPEVVGFTVMLLGAIALWRVRPRSGVRR
ncbi:hypothetical protein [Nocardia carnea]|nr:hypothetical protein [Nocardia carnea]